MGGERMDARNGPVKRNDAAEAQAESPASGSKLWAALKDRTLGALDKSAKAVAALAVAGAVTAGAAGAVAVGCSNDTLPFDTDGEDQADVSGDADSSEAVDGEASDVADVADVGEVEETDVTVDVDLDVVDGEGEEDAMTDGEGTVCEGEHAALSDRYYLTEGVWQDFSGYRVRFTSSGAGVVSMELGCGTGSLLESNAVFMASVWTVTRPAPESTVITIMPVSEIAGQIVCRVTVASTSP